MTARLPMRRREFLELTGRTGLALAGLPALSACRERDRPPNFLLIMADDLGYECLGCNGGTSYSTPRLDRMAREGLRFEHCYSLPLCTPSRVQLMTGLYNNRNYLRFGYLDPRETTFANLLRQAGYATCIAGKWQLGGGKDAPAHFGFDEHALTALLQKAQRYWNPKLSINGELTAHGEQAFGPDVVSDYLCDFMARNRDRPFLAYYPMILPHSPFLRTPDAPGEGVRMTGRSPQDHFAGLVAYMDKLVGKLLDQLDELGVAERTVVIFCGDNGTDDAIVSRLGEREIRGGKGRTSDSGIHVPLIVRWPGVTPAAGVTDALVDFSDMLPTMMDLAGVSPPAQPDLDGVSLAPLLRREPFEGRSWSYSWYQRDGIRERAWQYVRDRRYKLFARGRFIDLHADPDELRPIAKEDLDAERLAAYVRLEAVLASQMAVSERVTRSMGTRAAEG